MSICLIIIVVQENYIIGDTLANCLSVVKKVSFSNGGLTYLTINVWNDCVRVFKLKLLIIKG